ncbi:uncharacterized protein L201_002839 [Kwoniella dendrophila CBS 6074]|uniref:Glycosyltransferase 61 catalytic domain-containing protein n=1 Tax=Kwoniella dendrophila CBS 6074 TaxID=1295534 RepID=A0AAX4JT59_9TREE
MYNNNNNQLRSVVQHYRRKGLSKDFIISAFSFLGFIAFLFISLPNFGFLPSDPILTSLDIIKPSLFWSLNCRTRCHGEGKLAGGLPGFYTFDKIWYKSGFFYIFTDQPDQIKLPPQNSISSGFNPIIIKPLSESPNLKIKSWFSKESIKCFPDETIWVNAGVSERSSEKEEEEFIQEKRRLLHYNYKRFNWEYHHYHFLAEAILGGIATLDVVRNNNTSDRHHDKPKVNKFSWNFGYSNTGEDEIRPEDKQWLFIPWETEWQDPYGLNQPIVNGLFHNHFVNSALLSKFTENDQWVGFERLAIIDRWASHRYNPKSNEWNKMALDVFSLLPASSSGAAESIFEPYRNNFLEYMHIKNKHRKEKGKSINELPKIIHVDRGHSSRHLTNQSHYNIISTLEELNKEGKANCVIGKLEDMDYVDQIKLFADADIIIGVHGNGLTHQMWMPSGGILIEIFPHGVFLRDYQVIAQVMGHQHIAILDSKIYTQEEWESEPGKLLASTGQANDQNIHLNKGFIGDLLETKLLELQ